MLAGGYGGENTGPVHRLAVDIYAAQHPAVPGKQSSQPVAAHLFVLCLVLERGVDPSFATTAITRFVEKYKQWGFTWLGPPPSLGDVTILDVMGPTNTHDQSRRVTRWAKSVWTAWKPHHDKVRGWADELGY
ncbi:MAG: DUF5946 family protein [Chloroflexota bacterium]|nr:DUF5946 family protein [Chloroflexota bacterium]